MSRTPSLLLLALALGGPLALTSPAAADPACDTASAAVVHEAEEASAATPAGPTTAPVLHGTVEPVACALP